jgi:23S rRNA pseudouridine955/2504/2580 synthase
MKEFTIGKNEAGQRFEKYLAKLLPNAPKSFIYKMLRKKNITLNGKRAMGNEMLSLTDNVRLFFSDETYAKFSEVLSSKAQSAGTFDFASHVIYEDEDFLIVNKPPGILSQPERAGGESLALDLTDYLLTSGKISQEELRTFHPAPVNRLDRMTSGLVLCGKSLRGSQFLSEIIKSREVKKYYLTVTCGEIKDGIYEAYLKKDNSVNKVTIRRDKAEGFSHIATGVQVLSKAGRYSLLDIDLITGRTHQIRSHLAWLGAPVIGDVKYGDRKLAGILKKDIGLGHQFLHAERIVFPRVQGDFSYMSGMTVNAPLTTEEERILARLGLSQGIRN